MKPWWIGVLRLASHRAAISASYWVDILPAAICKGIRDGGENSDGGRDEVRLDSHGMDFVRAGWLELLSTTAEGRDAGNMKCVLIRRACVIDGRPTVQWWVPACRTVTGRCADGNHVLGAGGAAHGVPEAGTGSRIK